MARAIRRSCALLILLLEEGRSQFVEWVRRRLKRRKAEAPEPKAEIEEEV